MTRPGPFFLALEERLRRVAEFPRVPARAAGKTLSFEVGVESYIGRPHADPDERAVVISFGHAGRPVQQGGAQSHARVASADDDPPEVKRCLAAFVVWPHRPPVQVERFFGVHGDDPGRRGAIAGDPCLAFDQVIQYLLAPSLPVRPEIRPLVGVLARLQPPGGLVGKAPHEVQVSRCTAA